MGRNKRWPTLSSKARQRLGDSCVRVRPLHQAAWTMYTHVHGRNFQILPPSIQSVFFFTIHGLYMDRVIPMAFVLMHQRQVGAYRQVLGCIKNRYAHLTGRPMQPDLIVTDFEMALPAAVETEFPTAEVRACFFHYCQAICKRARQQRLCGPGGDQMGNSELMIRKMMALAFLPVAVVRANFQIIAQEFANLVLATADGVANVLQYFRRVFLDGFRPPTWNVYRRNMDTRSNNHVEGNNQYIILFQSRPIPLDYK